MGRLALLHLRWEHVPSISVSARRVKHTCSEFYFYRILASLDLFNHVILPLQVTSSIIEIAAWCCMLVMIALETRIYIYEFRWYIRFVVIYILVGEAAMFNLVLSVRQYYSSRYSTHETCFIHEIYWMLIDRELYTLNFSMKTDFCILVMQFNILLVLQWDNIQGLHSCYLNNRTVVIFVVYWTYHLCSSCLEFSWWFICLAWIPIRVILQSGMRHLLIILITNLCLVGSRFALRGMLIYFPVSKYNKLCGCATLLHTSIMFCLSS